MSERHFKINRFKFKSWSLWSVVTLPIALFATAGRPIANIGLSNAERSPDTTSDLVQTQIAQDIAPVPDGIYLYGEDSVPNRIGTAYMVFEVRHNRAVGAFYMPHSSFDCFYGQIGAREFDVTVVNSYDRTAYTYAVARADSAVASGSNVAVTPEFTGFHRIEPLSDRDREIVETCTTQLQGELR
ncbi:hypothetical protein CKA32_003078 [Geitlerinema sp. FC II]|nr:hypothetical protein CKA32_003078 [Geitlerinema sp. FC II]